MYSEKEERINQSLLGNSSLNQDLNNKLNKCICRIEVKNVIGSGFLIKLQKGKKDSFFLITNEHVITKEMIKSNDKIKFYYDNINDKNKFIELKLKDRFIKTYDYMNIDACLIEILDSDNVDKACFLKTPKLENIYKYKKKKKKKINILQFPLGGDLHLSNDEIIEINLAKYELYYRASTQPGSSGSPIILENSEEVIGIHKQGGKNKNVGNFIFPIILSLKNNFEYVENFIINDNETYEGEINNNKMREGFGKSIYKDGSYYKGQWLNDKKYGIGIEYNKNGKIKYEGEFVNNEYDGQGTKYDKIRKWKYIGQWKNGKKNGKGVEYDNKNNKIYEGDFINNEYSGQGYSFYEKGNLAYDGYWENNKKNGKGKTYFENEHDKIEYDGNFINDCYHGQGIFYNRLGYVLYNGEWKNNKKNGFGRKYYEYEDNKLEYEGMFVEDEFHGKGIYYYKNGKKKYEGNWKNNKKSGKGKNYYENEILEYQGNFENNEYNGKGTSYYKNGNIEYVGDWKNNKKNGKGKKFNENNKLEYEGEFLDNEFHGYGISYYENRQKKYDGNWKHNKKDGHGKEYFINGIIRFRGIFSNDKVHEGEGYKNENGRMRRIKLIAGRIENNNGCFN